MNRIDALDPESATGEARNLLEAVEKKLGMVPNLTRGLAHSPAALEGYLSLMGALAKGPSAPASASKSPWPSRRRTNATTAFRLTRRSVVGSASTRRRSGGTAAQSQPTIARAPCSAWLGGSSIPGET
jgi:hypothetical protein